MSEGWYFSKGSIRLGPVSFDELSRLAAAGTLQAQDLVWKDELSEWLKAELIVGLFNTKTAKLPPTLPEVVLNAQQVDANFEDNVACTTAFNLATQALREGQKRVAERDFEGATTFFNKAIEVCPEYWEPYFFRGSLLLDQGDRSKSYADFERASQLEPKSIAALLLQGWNEFASDNLEQVINAMDQAISIQPDFKRFYRLRGGAKRRLGDLNGALQDFDTAISLDNDYVSAIGDRATLYSDSGEKEKAIEDLTAAIRIVESSGREEIKLTELAYRKAVILAADLSRLSDAIECIENVLTRRPVELSLVRLRRQIHMHLSDDLSTVLPDWFFEIKEIRASIHLKYIFGRETYDLQKSLDLEMEELAAFILRNPKLSGSFFGSGTIMYEALKAIVYYKPESFWLCQSCGAEADCYSQHFGHFCQDCVFDGASWGKEDKEDLILSMLSHSARPRPRFRRNLINHSSLRRW